MKSQRKEPHYGYFAPGYFFIVIISCISLGILVAVFFWKIVGIVILGFALYTLLTYWMANYFSRLRESYSLSEIIKLQGNEYALDVGCGLGKATIAVAKLLKEGKVIGIDIWSKFALTGNSPEKAYRNAEIEGVKEKVDFRTGNLLDLPFPNNSFDFVIAATVFSSFHNEKMRLKVLSEVFRVLRSDGKFLLIETLRSWIMLVMSPSSVLGLLSEKDCINLLEKTGFVNLKYTHREGVMGYFLVEKPK